MEFYRDMEHFARRSDEGVEFVDLKRAAEAAGRHPSTVVKWWRTGKFAPDEVFVLKNLRGYVYGYQMDLEAIHRVAAQR